MTKSGKITQNPEKLDFFFLQSKNSCKCLDYFGKCLIIVVSVKLFQ